MLLNRMRTLAIIAVATSCLGANQAHAGPFFDWFGIFDNPPSSYSPLRYWAPNAARVNDHFGPRLSVVAPDRHPEIAPTFTIIKFPSATSPPAETIIERPAPPATSGSR